MAFVLKWFFLGCILFVYARLMVPYGALLVRFVFEEPLRWNRYVEKPRLFFHAIGLFLMHTSHTTIMEHLERPHSFFFLSSSLVFFLGMLLALVTWSRKFKGVFIPKIKERLRSRKNFNISATESQLGRLYDNMVRYDMVDFDRTSKEDFVNCLLMDWDAHGSKIHLRLGNPACKEFYELFRTTFPKNGLQLVDFVKNSDILRRGDGLPYNYDTVRNALTRNRVSKRSKELEAVFAPFS
tara:strand:- start:191 stop:907 length:717 start_codon:yes stop_codon:yes gene_type:complete